MNPAQQPVLLTEPVRNPKAAREKTVQVMFEAFNVPACHVASTPSLALCSTSRTSLGLSRGALSGR
ncbi:hypothetical protein [Streptomyces sp. NPDC001970]